MGSILCKLNTFLNDPQYRLKTLSKCRLLGWMTDEEYIKRQYKLMTGYDIDLKNPKRFNEKLNWLKIHYRNPLFTKMVDKAEVKEYLKTIIGEEYIIPAYGVWNHFDEIDFKKLPNQFVLKATHESGDSVIICRDKATFDYSGAKKSIEKSLKNNYYYSYKEWPYKNVKPRILAEQYMQDGNNPFLNVFKVFCFSGNPEIIETIQNDKTSEISIDYFDVNRNLLDLKQGFPNSKNPLARPKTLDKMLELSCICSKGYPFLETDWYEINGKIFFSEFTFFPDAGYGPFYPDDWDTKLGELIAL